MILFVGDKPSPKMKLGATPFEGAACEARLKEWLANLGLSHHAYQSNSYFIINQVEIEQSPLLLTICKGTGIVALGNVASKRLTSMNIPHFKLPHPSGRNRQINDKTFIASKLDECKKYIEEKAKV